MTSKIFRSTIFVAILVLLCAIGIILGVLYSYFDTLQGDQLEDELRLAAIGTEESGLGFLQKIDSDHFRLTWVATDGHVIYDTHADEHGLEIAKYLTEEVRIHDPLGNAPVTIGSNYMPWVNAQKCADFVK